MGEKQWRACVRACKLKILKVKIEKIASSERKDPVL
jgi:hypothetical protein